MTLDPFAGHASPISGSTSPWTLASSTPTSNFSDDTGTGQHPMDILRSGTGATITGGPSSLTSLGSTSPTYGAGFGSLDQDFGLAQFNTDPGYQWRMDQGMQALDRSASARGQLFSGGELKALDRYNQGFASNEYQNAYNRYTQNQGNRFNRLAALAGIGQASQNAMTGYAANMGPNLAQGYYGIGNAQAAGAYGQANANVGLLNGLGSAWGYYNANKPPSGGGSSGGSGGGYSGASGTGFMW